jgi:hypothetical protein
MYAQDDLLSEVNRLELKGVGADLHLGAWDPMRGTWDNIEVTQPGAAPIPVQAIGGYGDPYPNF